ncbi:MULTISPECIES: beta strand repeat-containing protein [Psychrobacter]|uniref:beta strand repeat-containing protein n=1 Tax=Psychrobacter TaxID=497 RepID=UPI000C348B7F|nr:MULTISPECIES: DUF11 domain-containing protein [Psychrobacter]PKG36360.1 hypothetical protein CXF65_02635 [Psychrobacter sp. Sarcosine-3u-12]
MKSNLFKYSVLTVGVVAAMGVAHAAQQPTGGTSAGSFDVANQASASYTVAGNTASQTATSNIVTISVSEQSSFTLVTDNLNKTINPQTGSTVNFIHTLKNEGNVNDTYTINLLNTANGTATGQDDFDYTLTGNLITYQIKNGTTNVGSPVSIANGGTIPLTPGQSAEITIVGTAATERLINKNGILTVSAESTYLKAKNPGTGPTVTNTYTATNVDNAKTTTPIYAITKSATTNLNNKTFDATNAGSYIDYTITVKNEGTVAGTNVRISDVLPTGLVAITDTNAANYQAPTTTGGTTNVTPTFSNNDKTITVTNQNIAIGQTITIKFRVKKETGTTLATGTNNIVNYAIVEDSTKDDGTFDLIDRSDDGVTTGGKTEKNYEDTTATPILGVDNNTQATVSTSNQTRAIAITTGVNKEVALLTSGANLGNTYSYTITNNGTDIIEAATAGSVLFSVKPTATETTNVTDNPKIEIARVFVDANGDGIFNSGDTVLPGTRVGTTSEYTYDLNAAKTTGFAPGAANAIKIGVEVVTTGTGSNATGEVNNIGNFETLTLAVLPQGPVNQTPAPASVNTTSKTTMQGINLLKFQAVATCGTSLASIVDGTAPGNWSQSNKTADVTQCLFYRLDAKNTFSTTSGTDINSVAISDTLVSSVTYRNDFTPSKAVTTPSQVSAPLIKGTFATLTPQETVTIKFSAKPSQTGTN